MRDVDRDLRWTRLLETPLDLPKLVCQCPSQVILSFVMYFAQSPLFSSTCLEGDSIIELLPLIMGSVRTSLHALTLNY